MGEQDERYFPTCILRFVLRDEPEPFNPMTTSIGGPVRMQQVRILQQLWQHEETGRDQWRDVPLEVKP